MSRTPSHGVRGPIARHTKLRSPGFLSQGLKAIAFIVSAVVVAVVGVGAYAYTDLTSTLQANAVTLDGQDTAPPDVEVLPNQAVNILLAGVDKCEEEWLEAFAGRCTAEMAEAQKDSYDGVLNDVNMVLHISPEPRRVTVISIPRDMMSPRPSCTDEEGNETYPVSTAQFNEAYGTGGLPCVARAAEELTGMEMHHAALMTWGGVIDITNAIGGVDVCVAAPISDPEHTGLELEAGDHTLEGMTALQFLRVRTGVGGSDLDRISNQQVYMGSLARKLVDEDTLTDVGALVRLANAVVHNAVVSTGIDDPMEMVQIAGAASGVPLEDYTFIQFPAIDYAPDPNRVAPDEASWQQVHTALEENQPLDLSEPEATETPEPTQEPTDDVAPTPTPTPTTVPLPSNLSGSNADQATCSNQDTALF